MKTLVYWRVGRIGFGIGGSPLVNWYGNGALKLVDWPSCWELRVLWLFGFTWRKLR